MHYFSGPTRTCEIEMKGGYSKSEQGPPLHAPMGTARILKKECYASRTLTRIPVAGGINSTPYAAWKGRGSTI